MKFLTIPTLQTALATICVCLCKHNSSWLASCIHTCTNETHSAANLQDLIPSLAAIIIGNTNLLAKVGIKSCRFATECVSFVHVWMQLANQLELCLHKQTQIVASAACKVGSQEFYSWIASLPLVSLLFIVIPTTFLNFLNFIYILYRYSNSWLVA